MKVIRKFITAEFSLNFLKSEDWRMLVLAKHINPGKDRRDFSVIKIKFITLKTQTLKNVTIKQGQFQSIGSRCLKELCELIKLFKSLKQWPHCMEYSCLVWYWNPVKTDAPSLSLSGLVWLVVYQFLWLLLNFSQTDFCLFPLGMKDGTCWPTITNCWIWCSFKSGRDSWWRQEHVRRRFVKTPQNKL